MEGGKTYFVEKGKTGNRSICKNCRKKTQALVRRLKDHYEKCKNENTGSSNKEVHLSTESIIL